VLQKGRDRKNEDEKIVERNRRKLNENEAPGNNTPETL